MLKDNHIAGEGNAYYTLFREYDPSLGRWWSTDPMRAKYEDMSPYIAFGANPVMFVDVRGDKPIATYVYTFKSYINCFSSFPVGFPQKLEVNHKSFGILEPQYNLKFDIVKTQKRFDGYLKKWLNNKKVYGNVGNFANNTNYFVTFAFVGASAIGGIASEGNKNIILPNSILNSLNEEGKLFHETIHLDKYNEFQTWAACYVAGFVDFSELQPKLTGPLYYNFSFDTERANARDYILQGAPDWFIQKYYIKENSGSDGIHYELKEGVKQDELMKDFQAVGKETLENIGK